MEVGAGGEWVHSNPGPVPSASERDGANEDAGPWAGVARRIWIEEEIQETDAGALTASSTLG
jgi:hypothetical protein